MEAAVGTAAEDFAPRVPPLGSALRAASPTSPTSPKIRSARFSDPPESAVFDRPASPTFGPPRRPATTGFDGPASPTFGPPRRSATTQTYASSVLEREWASQCVLSFDGGGIRGYSSLLIIKRLMEIIGEIEREYDDNATTSFSPGMYRATQNNDKHKEDAKVVDPPIVCQYLPCHYFDYIGGTSTGGLISIMLGRLRMGVDEALQEYKSLGGDIFGHGRWFSYRGPFLWPRGKYSSRRMHRIMNSVTLRRLSRPQLDVGGDSFSSPPQLCKTVCVAYDDKPADSRTRDGGIMRRPPYIFRSFDHFRQDPRALDPLEKNPGTAHTVPIADVACATSAAPMYFKSVVIQGRKFVDGGFGTNNPAVELMDEVVQMSNGDAKVVKAFVSVGTGISEISRLSEKMMELMTWLGAMKKLATDSEGAHTHMLRSKAPYFRFNVGMSHNNCIEETDGLVSRVVSATSNHVMPDKDNVEMIDGSETSKSIDEQPKNRGKDPQRKSKSKNEKSLGNMKLDEWKTKGGIFQRPEEETTLYKIEAFTDEYLKSADVQQELRRVARILVDIRRERSKDSLWKMVSTGLQYRCPFPGCPKGMKRRNTRENLEVHLTKFHEMAHWTSEERAALKQVLDRGKLVY